MRFATMILAGLVLAACASNRAEPVPETGAFSVKFLKVDNDYFLKVDKVGVSQPVTLFESSHPNRGEWKRRDWEAYADKLFPGDEVDFNMLRELRGSNLVPAGLISPTPAVIPPCDTTNDRTFAKLQQRIVRRAPKKQLNGDITMVTTCLLHEGLTPSQYKGIHERPNPYRFPTRYETVIDLDRDDKAEQRNVRIRNVPKARIVEFIEKETDLDKKRRQKVLFALDRM